METGIVLFSYLPEGEISVDRQIYLMQKNGFNHTFLMSNSSELTDKNVAKLQDGGIIIDTLHSPFAGINAIWHKGEDGDRMLDLFIDGVKRCSEYKIPTLIMHLSSKYPPPPICDVGYERFKRLVAAAREYDVTLAFENQRCLANLAFIFEQFPDAGFCWDIGHEGCFTSGISFSGLFGDRLCALHIHDNFRIPDNDAHLLPFDGGLDFDHVANELVRLKYDGTLMLEVFRSNSNLYCDTSDEEYYRRAAEGVEKLNNITKNKA